MGRRCKHSTQLRHFLYFGEFEEIEKLAVWIDIIYYGLWIRVRTSFFGPLNFFLFNQWHNARKSISFPQKSQTNLNWFEMRDESSFEWQEFHLFDSIEYCVVANFSHICITTCKNSFYVLLISFLDMYGSDKSHFQHLTILNFNSFRRTAHYYMYILISTLMFISYKKK